MADDEEYIMNDSKESLTKKPEEEDDWAMGRIMVKKDVVSLVLDTVTRHKLMDRRTSPLARDLPSPSNLRRSGKELVNAEFMIRAKQGVD